MVKIFYESIELMQGLGHHQFNADSFHLKAVTYLLQEALLSTVTGARQTQDMGMKDKKDLTTQKNTLQIRIEGAIEEISTSGYMHYMETDPVLAKRFKDLIPGSSTGGSGSSTEKGKGGQGVNETSK